LLVALRSPLAATNILNGTGDAARAFVGEPSRRSAVAPRDATCGRQHRLLRGISALVSTELHEHAARADLRMCASFTTHTPRNDLSCE